MKEANIPNLLFASFFTVVLYFVSLIGTFFSKAEPEKIMDWNGADWFSLTFLIYLMINKDK